MYNSTHNILKYKYYINKNENELYIITETENITFSEYLEGILMEYLYLYESMRTDILEIKKYIQDMKN